jgi:hypothetical protein
VFVAHSSVNRLVEYVGVHDLGEAWEVDFVEEEGHVDDLNATRS